jgi:hypothetical protein
MFGLMKNLIKDNANPVDAMTLADLHTGCVIGFGFMPQKSVSGKRVAVSAVNSYLFESGNFVAYRLESENTDINLIVADQEDPASTYLALSQRIEPRLFESIFAGETPQYWFALSEGEVIEVNASVLGAMQGWLTGKYTLMVTTQGRFLEGDYRLRKSADHNRLSRPFEYVLLVDEDNEYALEAEKYEDGTLHVFATLYRPATDIGEITRAPKSPSLSSSSKPELLSTESIIPLSMTVDKIAHVSPADTSAALKKENDTPLLAPTSEPEKKIPELEIKNEVSAIEKIPFEPVKIEVPAMSVVQSEAEITPVAPTVPELPIHNKFGRIQPAPTQEQSVSVANTLACDLRLAGLLIDEAQRNQMLLSELVRKVIDLPTRVNEQVFIPFAMDDKEAAELARRYDLPAGDHEAVKAQIIEELKRFVGDKN